MKSGTRYGRRTQELTPRQEEILGLIAEGRTNGEIADRLGMTLDGAKWHVSEIIAAFGVTSREEAVRAWRSEQSLGQRLFRSLLAPILAHKIVAAAVAGAAVVVAGGAIAIGIMTSGSPSNYQIDLPLSPTHGQVVAHPFFTGYRMIDSKVGAGQTTDTAHPLVLTEDGGRTWRDISPALPSDVTLLQRTGTFTDSNHGFVIGARPRTSPNSPVQATVYWTADRGRTWHQNGSPLALDNDHPIITFVDPQHGWVMDTGNNSTLFRTTDGGHTWQILRTVMGGNLFGGSAASQICGYDLHFVTPSRGFTYGVCGSADVALPTLARSDDGGATWQRVDLPGAAPGKYTGTGTALSLPNSTDGYFSLGRPLYATHDGGMTWALVSQVPPNPAGTGYSAIQFVDALHGWVMGPGTWQRTVDGGKTWESFVPNPTMPSAYFISPTEGFGWPGFGQTFTSDAATPPLYHTTDGGRTWQSIQ